MSHHREAQPLSLDDARDWYEAIVESLIEHRAAVLASLRSGNVRLDSRFFGLSPEEVDAHFTFLRRELEDLTALNLMASAEAALQLDYDDRVANKRKDVLSKQYQRLQRGLRLRHWWQRQIRPQLDEHILKTMKDSGVVPRHVVSEFRAILNLRHYLAHGRYWTVNLGRSGYSPDDVYRAAHALVAALPA
jgi:hypothetical protein